MLVRQLIGRQAGTIIDLAYHAAQAGLSSGTCEIPTDEELAQHGLGPAPPITVDAKPEEFLPDYAGNVREDGLGYDVTWRGYSQALNDAPLPNLVAARDFARQHFLASQVPAEDPALAEIPDDWENLSAADMRALASEFDSDVRTKAEAHAVISEELARRVEAGAVPKSPLPPT